MANIKIDQLAAEIAKELSKYSQEVVEKVNISSEKVGKAAVKQLRQTSPKKTGKYAKSWTMVTEKEFGQPHKRIIHAKAPHYRLTHLLEHGHAKRGGGRVEGKPHIRPAEEMVIREFMAEVEEAIKRG
ncbi:MAG TPA: HK97 gp10 family phage protein [Thermoanaerobacterales bacterium]|nr:HK97 gp10 family phage protein [Thermoanaerobacterales bacterium]